MEQLIEQLKESIQHIQQSLHQIEQTIDGFSLKHSIEEKLLQKEELKVSLSTKMSLTKHQFCFCLASS